MNETIASIGSVSQFDKHKENLTHWVEKWEASWLQNPNAAIEVLKKLTFLLHNLEVDLSSQASSASSSFNQEEILFLQKAVKSIELNIEEEDFGVNELSKAMNISYRQLHRRLQTSAGLSPALFIRKIRLKRAHELLANKIDKPTQVAYMVGFKNCAFFSRCFKEQYGITPYYVYKNG